MISLPESWAGRLLVVLVVASLGSVAFTVSTSSAAFGAFNDGWDGTSSLRDTAERSGATINVGVDSGARLETSPSETMVLVLTTSRATDDADIAALRSFVRRGGTLVVAEDVGENGNAVLAGVGAETRFNGSIVRDMRYYGATSGMPVVTNVEPHTRTRGVDELMLNYGTVLDVPNASRETGRDDVTVVASTSQFAYLDRDGDAVPDENETLRSRPVVSVESVGDGQVVAVSDPSVFINAMQTRASNGAFFDALVGDHRYVVVEYSNAGTQPTVQMALLWLENRPTILALLGMSVAVAIAAVAQYRDDETQ